ncbi:MAG: hypothetical protein R3182_11325, partial [Draconibacterium sp.]|nr:hypothetical protein [Draconibacterium sp.]
EMVYARIEMATTEVVQFLVYGSQSGSVAERLGMWLSAIRAGQQNILFGVGADGFSVLKENMMISGEISRQVANRQLHHSDILQTFALYGMSGVCAYLYYWFFLGKKASSLLVWLVIGLVLISGLTDHYSYLISTTSQITSLLIIGFILASYYPLAIHLNIGLLQYRILFLIMFTVGSLIGANGVVKLQPRLNELEYGQKRNETLVKSMLLPNNWVVIRTAKNLMIELPECDKELGKVIYADVFGLMVDAKDNSIQEFHTLYSSKFEPNLNTDGSCLVTWALSKNFAAKQVVVGMHNYGPRLSEYHLFFNDHYRLIQR